METNISDEFQVLKDELKKLNIEDLRIVKVGNGNMDFQIGDLIRRRKKSERKPDE